jgi:WD40 repeat protein
VRCLEAALQEVGLKRTRAEVKAAVQAGAQQIGALLDQLVEKARPPAPADQSRPAAPKLVLALDQGEELFLSEGINEARAFLELIRDLMLDPASNLIVLFTIRSDSLESLQTATQLESINAQTFSLPPLARGAYQTVIEGPAARVCNTRRALTIEPALTAALLTDIETGGGKDALPLLAFTLERLYLEHGGDGNLKLSEYRQIGGIGGSIEAAVEQALKNADYDDAVPKDRVARLALLRRALIPWLAGIDPETGSPRRRVARLSEIPQEARPLVDHLIEARLLATDVLPQSSEKTIEPAHEALLRQWGLLQGWLEEDFAALATMEGAKRAARDWVANKKDKAWLGHSAGRLDDAEALLRREDLARSFDATDRVYLDACRSAENSRRNRELEDARRLAESQKESADRQRQVTKRTRLGLVAASILAVLAMGLAVFGFDKAMEAERRSIEAVRNETVGLAGLSAVALARGDPGDAVRLALAAWPRQGDRQRPLLRLALASLAAALPQLRERTRLLGHEDYIRAAAFSPDGTRIVTASGDRTARLWDAVTGAEILTLKGHEDGINGVAFSRSGTRIVTLSDDDTVRYWDVATGAQLAMLPCTAAHSVVFSRDGKRILVDGKDWSCFLDTVTWKTFLIQRGYGNGTLSPDGTRIVAPPWEETLRMEKTAKIWDTETGAEIITLRGHEDRIESTAFSPDGTRIVTASDDKTARVWDAATGAEIFTLTGHEDAVISAVFSSDGTRILTRSTDWSARVWNATTGAEIVSLRLDKTSIVAAAFSPDDSLVVTTGYWDKVVRIWDVTTGTEIITLTGTDHVWSAAFSPDSTRLLTVSRNRTAQIWDVAVAKSLRLTGDSGAVLSAVFSPNGTRIVTAATHGDVARVWDVESRAELVVLKGHADGVRTAAFSPDGVRIVTASWDRTAKIWDTATGAEIITLRGHEDGIESAAFSPDGTRIVTASRDKTARVWDAATGAEILALGKQADGVTSAAFSPDGTRIVTTSEKTARVWDATTGAEILALRGQADRVTSAAFSPDGSRIVTNSSDSMERLWDATTGIEILALRGNGRDPMLNVLPSVAFSPDGNRIATATTDGTVRIWDAATGAEVFAIKGQKAWIYSAAFSPDGTRIVTASSKGARIWNLTGLEKGDAFAIACARLGINTDLTEVRARYALGKLAPICGDHRPLPVDASKLE